MATDRPDHTYRVQPEPISDPSEVMQQIGLLFDAFSTGSADPESAAHSVQAYCIAVDRWSLATIRMAVQRFLRGDVPDHNPAFRPTPPQLARECRRIGVAYEASGQVHNKPVDANRIEGPEALHARQVAQESKLTEEDRKAIVDRIRRSFGTNTSDPLQQPDPQQHSPSASQSSSPSGPTPIKQLRVGNGEALIATLSISKRKAGHHD